MISLDNWHRNGRRFAYNGHEIFYAVEGNGPVLLCIHGFPTASWDWSWLWPGLVQRFRVVAPDMIGFGFSAKPPKYPYSILDQATLHERLLEQLGVASVHILAHDYGDTVAQELLARQLEHENAAPAIQSVCLLNGGIIPEAHRARRMQHLLAGPLGPLLARLITVRTFRKSFREIFGASTQPSDAELQGFWRLLVHNRGRRVMPKLIGYMQERLQHRDRWVNSLKNAQVPLRFINGTDDPISGRHMAEAFRQCVPAADVVLLEGIGHYPQVEAPNRVLESFLSFHADRVR